MAARISYAPRDCLTVWPTGTVKPGIPPKWAERAEGLAAWVVLMEARLRRDRTNVAALARDMDVSRASIDTLLRGQTWPRFDLLVSMARAMHYWDIWGDLSRRSSSD